jgi:hypothetical protein
MYATGPFAFPRLSPLFFSGDVFGPFWVGYLSAATVNAPTRGGAMKMEGGQEKAYK